jgi:hypothetical protein
MFRLLTTTSISTVLRPIVVRLNGVPHCHPLSHALLDVTHCLSATRENPDREEEVDTTGRDVVHLPHAGHTTAT